MAIILLSHVGLLWRRLLVDFDTIGRGAVTVDYRLQLAGVGTIVSTGIHAAKHVDLARVIVLQVGQVVHSLSRAAHTKIALARDRATANRAATLTGNGVEVDA